MNLRTLRVYNLTGFNLKNHQGEYERTGLKQ